MECDCFFPGWPIILGRLGCHSYTSKNLQKKVNRLKYQAPCSLLTWPPWPYKFTLLTLPYLKLPSLRLVSIFLGLCSGRGILPLDNLTENQGDAPISGPHVPTPSRLFSAMETQKCSHGNALSASLSLSHKQVILHIHFWESGCDPYSSQSP